MLYSLFIENVFFVWFFSQTIRNSNLKWNLKKIPKKQNKTKNKISWNPNTPENISISIFFSCRYCIIKRERENEEISTDKNWMMGASIIEFQKDKKKKRIFAASSLFFFQISCLSLIIIIISNITMKMCLKFFQKKKKIKFDVIVVVVISLSNSTTTIKLHIC